MEEESQSSKRPRILVVDDHENILSLFTKVLGGSYMVVTASDGVSALAQILAGAFDVVVSDVRMPGADGFEILKVVKARAPETEVVLMTGFGAIDRAVEAIRLGAYAYIQKPLEPNTLELVVARAVERKRLREQAICLKRALEGAHGLHRLVGKSESMQEVYALLERAAASDIRVLLLGETGTGKELAARAIHHQSERREGPFVAINCGALPPELFESELFGYAKGAFTGARTSRAGLFEEANGGTLFLDEVGDLPPSAQVKLNRALQEKEIRRVGENTRIAVNVRIMAATHRDLLLEAQNGRFRDDLFYRLSILPIRLPALRERRDDIPLLAMHFLQKHANATRGPIDGFDGEALRALIGYSWPGNVRELENTVERALAIAGGPLVSLADLPPELRGAREGALPPDLMVQLPFREAIELARERVSREYLLALMREFQGNVTRAAERAGVERESLHRLLRRYGIRSEDFKPRG
ncbi:MAG: sigma-54-dependent Fis family transcriptional regulator [Deltaproteobacteria bacterium]|nr:sigma-54-dependent Fis family transcriptional regulator [Deltaproteobacteria bacterium]